MSEVKSGFLSTLVNVFADPKLAFSELKSSPSIFLPLAFLLISLLLPYAWYFSVVDFDYLTQAMVADAGPLSGQEQDAIVKSYQSMGVMGLGLATVISSSVFMVIMYLIQGAYISLVSQFGAHRLSFKPALSLTIWSAMPSLLTFIAMAIVIALNPEGKISFYDLNPLSFTALGLDAGDNRSFKSMYDTLSPIMIYSLALLALGYGKFTASSFGKSIILMALPYALVFGVWAGFALS